MKRTVTITALTAILVFASTAGAATAPGKGTIWAKIAAAYTTQARAHGLTVTCTPWNTILSMHCQIERAGKVVGGLYPSWPPKHGCVATFRYTGGPAVRAQAATVDVCKARWWTAPLPAPWSPRG